jgi:hypothetical protein
MGDDYVDFIYNTIPEEMRTDCLNEVKDYLEEQNRKPTPLTTLPVADRDRKNRFPRADQDTHIKELSTTAFLWEHNVKVDGQKWEHDLHSYDFDKDDTIYRHILENEVPETQPESGRAEHPITINSPSRSSSLSSSPEAGYDDSADPTFRMPTIDRTAVVPPKVEATLSPLPAQKPKVKPLPPSTPIVVQNPNFKPIPFPGQPIEPPNDKSQPLAPDQADRCCYANRQTCPSSNSNG